jgi:hypothetical protein
MQLARYGRYRERCGSLRSPHPVTDCDKAPDTENKSVPIFAAIFEAL